MKRLLSQSIVVCSMLIGISITACDTNTSESAVVEQNLTNLSDSVYACPMHPEITGEQGDQCSKCGMPLQLLENQSDHNIEVGFTSIPQNLEAGAESELKLSILNNGRHASLDVVHEKKIHLLIVDEDLGWFDHIHPLPQPDGSYQVKETFPHGGKYFVFADFKPSGGAGRVHKQTLVVQGDRPSPMDAVQNKWVSEVNGYKVTLINGNDFQTNRPQHLGIRIEKDGYNITADDLQAYLGAIAHVVIIGKKDKDMLHVHPGSNAHVPVHGETRFDKPGIYRMWIQFQIDGTVQTADFTVKVKEGLEKAEDQPHNHIGHQH